MHLYETIPCTRTGLGSQGVELESSSQERVQQLVKSAHMSMTREAIQIETNRQLPLLIAKKGNPVMILVLVVAQS